VSDEEVARAADPEREATSWRWWIALALAVGAAALFFLSRAYPNWRVCEEALAVTGSTPTATICKPLGVADLSVVLLPVAILLFPDLAELAIPGLISLKRDVAVQAEKQERLEKSLVQVEQRVSQVQNVNIFDYPTEKFARLADKEEAFMRGERDG
jgi:hypothetical protein